MKTVVSIRNFDARNIEQRVKFVQAISTANGEEICKQTKLKGI